jgi:hypothetical protein
VKRLWNLLGVGVVVAIVAKRGGRAKQVYVEEVSTGSKPIEAVGTAIAAFIGLDTRPTPRHSGGTRDEGR